MSRMAIALLGLALFGTSACANLMNSGSNETPEGRSTTSGGSALGTPGSNGPATGAPRTVNGGGGGGLRDDRGMHPERRAGDGGGDRQRRHLGQRAQNAPDERALALFVGPRVEMVGHPQCVKTGFLGSSGLSDQVVRIELLTAEEVTDMRHVGHVPGKPGGQSR